MDLVITQHAEERRKRLGINKRSVKRQGEMAFTRGKVEEDLRGESLMWLRSMKEGGDNLDYRIFNGHLFIYKTGTERAVKVLVTMIKVPSQIMKNIMTESGKS